MHGNVYFCRILFALPPCRINHNGLESSDRSDKGIILDINKKKIIRTIAKWSGNISKDGKYTLYAPSR